MAQETEFNVWLENKKLSSRTVIEYMSYYKYLLMFREFNQDTINSFISQHNNNVARAFLKSYIQYIKLNGELLDEEKIELSILEIPKITGRHKRKIPDVLSKTQIEMIEGAMNKEGEKMMLLLSFYCGLRKSDIEKIMITDFNWSEWLLNKNDNGVLTIQSGKGDKKANLFVPSFLMKRLETLIQDNYEYFEINTDKPIFPKGHKWMRILHRASLKGLGFRVKIHTIRHSFATFCLEQGLDITAIKELMRHEDIGTTSIYLHVNRKKLGQTMKGIFKNVEDENKIEKGLEELEAAE